MKSICDCEKNKKHENLSLANKCMITNQDQTTQRILINCEKKNIVEDECFLFLEYVNSFEIMFSLAKNFWKFDEETRFNILDKTSVDPFLMPDLFEPVCKAFGVDFNKSQSEEEFENSLNNMKKEITRIVTRQDRSLWFWYPGLRRSFYYCIKGGRFNNSTEGGNFHCDDSDPRKKKVLDSIIDLAEELFPSKIRNDIGY